MLHRHVIVCLVAVCFVVGSVLPPASSAAQSLEAAYFPLTGEVQFRNPGSQPVSFVFYSIRSESGALNGDDGVWLSIADTHDTSGDGFIDAENEWIEIADGSGELGEELAEGAPFGSVGVLPPFRAISLGRIVTPNVPLNDLTFEVFDENEMLVPLIEKELVAGDYNEDRRVDEKDFTLWKTFFGATFTVRIDGNLNGVVDAADYTIWRDNLGLELPAAGGEGAGSLLASTAAVPEPTGAVVALGLLAALSLARTGRRKS